MFIFEYHRWILLCMFWISGESRRPEHLISNEMKYGEKRKRNNIKGVFEVHKTHSCQRLKEENWREGAIYQTKTHTHARHYAWTLWINNRKCTKWIHKNIVMLLAAYFELISNANQSNRVWFVLKDIHIDIARWNNFSFFTLFYGNAIWNTKRLVWRTLHTYLITIISIYLMQCGCVRIGWFRWDTYTHNCRFVWPFVCCCGDWLVSRHRSNKRTQS